MHTRLQQVQEHFQVHEGDIDEEVPLPDFWGGCRKASILYGAGFVNKWLFMDRFPGEKCSTTPYTVPTYTIIFNTLLRGCRMT